jgi:phosphoglucomutase
MALTVMIDQDNGYTPTPSVSRAILAHTTMAVKTAWPMALSSHLRTILPSMAASNTIHTNGGPADTTATKWIENFANDLLGKKLQGVSRIPYEKALRAGTTQRFDFVSTYVNGLGSVLDMESLRGLNLGVDPLGGAGVAYWPRIAEKYGLKLTVVNTSVDPTFRFMTLDWDGKIRMDCSSPYAMESLIALKDRFDVAFACDTDHDRHGIVAPSVGLLNPNHYLAVAIDYLFRHRPGWKADAGVGKTLVSSSIIDRVAASLPRRLLEVPVGFKWFVDGLLDGSLGFGGEESAGASFLSQRWISLEHR